MENLKSHTGKFFEVSAKMQETQEDGSEKNVKHTIAIGADSFGEAETKAIEEFVGADVEIVSESIAPYKEVFQSDNVNDENFYKAKVEFITIDEKTEKEKRSKCVYLVQAATLGKALAYINDVMERTMMDFVSVGVVASSVEEFYAKNNANGKQEG